MLALTGASAPVAAAPGGPPAGVPPALASWRDGEAKTAVTDFVACVVYELCEDGPVLVKTMNNLFVDDKSGKPAGIHQFIGHRPIACFGNSDGDLRMLEYTAIDNPRPSLGLIVHHTDDEREYAYDRQPKSSGKLVDALAEAPKRG